MKKRILFVANVDWFFVSHRLPIAIEAIRQGYEVHLAAAFTDQTALLRSHGLVLHSLSMDRDSVNPFRELRSLWQIAMAIRDVRPHIIHLVTVKPVIFGGIAARLLGVPGVVAAVSGLGFLFMAPGWKAGLMRTFVLLPYRWVFGTRNLAVVFQNPDDRDRLQRWTGLCSEKCVMIRGSGVDLSAYVPQPLPPGPCVVVMAARLLSDKGIGEFVAAAALLVGRGLEARFWVAGDRDPDSRASISVEQLQKWKMDGPVIFLGKRSEIGQLFAQAHVVVLPSYREGLPKVLIEAAASGRAVVTTDVAGCRDAIEPGITGLLVPPRDASALAAAIEALIKDRAMCDRMGHAGRLLAEREFSIDKVVDAHLAVYRRLWEAR